MSAPLAGALGVVRVQVAADVYVAALPAPTRDAKQQFDDLSTRVALAGDSSQLVFFDRGDDLPCLLRARDVITIDVVSPEDPSC